MIGSDGKRETGILMSAPMVLAEDAGRKTMTRRVLTLPRSWVRAGYVLDDQAFADPGLGGGGYLHVHRPFDQDGVACDTFSRLYCPYGEIGDRLYRRERWAVGKCADGFKPAELDPPTWLGANGGLWFEADHAEPAHPISPRGRWRQGMFMPRWASRSVKEITAVRVERLQDISEADANREGAPVDHSYSLGFDCATRRGGFRTLWESLNAPRGYGWDVNPWVWVISYKRWPA